jgi:hypothetical protein
MSFSHPNRLLEVRTTGHCRHQQSVGQGAQVEAPIEAIDDRAEVALGLLAESKGMIGPADSVDARPLERSPTKACRGSGKKLIAKGLDEIQAQCKNSA